MNSSSANGAMAAARMTSAAISEQSSGQTDAPEQRSAAEKSLSDLLPRILSGIVMIGAALTALYLGGSVWTIAIGLCAIAMCFEWQSMVHGGQKNYAIAALLSAATLACFVVGLFFGLFYGVGLALGLAATLLLFWLLQPGSDWGWMAFGVCYIAIPSLAMIWLRDQIEPNGLLLISFLFVVVWATDIGAYTFGRLIGGPKIFPLISPKKTWAGSIGGLASAAGLACLLKPGFDLEGSYMAIASAALALSSVSQLGDALESALKRGFGVKDSGTLIPGHGGVLDRLDSLLVCAPVLAAIIWVSTV